MKTGGIIVLFLGALNLIIGIIGLSKGYADKSSRIPFGISMTILGVFLINRAKFKEKELKEKEKWNREDKWKDEKNKDEWKEV